MAALKSDTIQLFEKIKSDILAGDIKPFYLLFGKEHYLIDKLCELLIANSIRPEERDFGLVTYYGLDAAPDLVVSTARQYPMMVSKQVVVVREAQMMKNLEKIDAYFSAIMPTTVLIICFKTPNDTGSSKNIDKRKSFYKHSLEKGVVFESNPLTENGASRWMEGYLKSNGFTMDRVAASLMLEYCGPDLDKLSSNIDKLLKGKKTGEKEITVKDIEDGVGMSRDYNAFELTKAISEKNFQKCYKIVNFFADAPKRFPIQVTMGALTSNFFRILKYHSSGGEKSRDDEVARVLGINPYFVREYRVAGKNYPLMKCMKIIACLKEYDYRSKSNTRGDADDGQLLIELVSKILNT